MSANPTKWSNTLKQFVWVGNSFDNSLELALKGSTHFLPMRPLDRIQSIDLHSKSVLTGFYMMRLLSINEFISNRAKRRIPKETNHTKFSEKLKFLILRYAHVRVLIGDKKYLFFRKFGVFCFLFTSVLRLALLSYYQRVVSRGVFITQSKM